MDDDQCLLFIWHCNSINSSFLEETSPKRRLAKKRNQWPVESDLSRPGLLILSSAASPIPQRLSKRMTWRSFHSILSKRNSDLSFNAKERLQLTLCSTQLTHQVPLRVNQWHWLWRSNQSHWIQWDLWGLINDTGPSQSATEKETVWAIPEKKDWKPILRTDRWPLKGVHHALFLSPSSIFQSNWSLKETDKSTSILQGNSLNHIYWQQKSELWLRTCPLTNFHWLID